MEFAILFGVALVVLAVGIRVGMLLAPRIERMADRAARIESGAEPEPAPEPELESGPPADHEEDDDRTD